MEDVVGKYLAWLCSLEQRSEMPCPDDSPGDVCDMNALQRKYRWVVDDYASTVKEPNCLDLNPGTDIAWVSFSAH